MAVKEMKNRQTRGEKPRDTHFLHAFDYLNGKSRERHRIASDNNSLNSGLYCVGRIQQISHGFNN